MQRVLRKFPKEALKSSILLHLTKASELPDAPGVTAQQLVSIVRSSDASIHDALTELLEDGEIARTMLGSTCFYSAVVTLHLVHWLVLGTRRKSA